MIQILRDVIFKYINIMVEDNNLNLMSLPVTLEYWIYIITELEDVYHFPVIQVIEQMHYDEFTLGNLSERLILISQ